MATHLPTSVRVFIVMAFSIGTVPPWAHAVKYAFVTSATTDGSINEGAFPTGIASANEICRRLAQSAGSIIPAANQAGPWLAWLSTSTPSSPSTTFTQATVPYLRTDGTQIAANWSGLISGTLTAPLVLDETGATTPHTFSWTGTLLTRGPSLGVLCGDWTASVAFWVKGDPGYPRGSGPLDAAGALRTTSSVLLFSTGGSPGGTGILHGRVKRGAKRTHPTQGKSADGALLVDGTFLLQTTPFSSSPAPTHRNQRCTYSPSREESIGSSGSCS